MTESCLHLRVHCCEQLLLRASAAPRDDVSIRKPHFSLHCVLELAFEQLSFHLERLRAGKKKQKMQM